MADGEEKEARLSQTALISTLVTMHMVLRLFNIPLSSLQSSCDPACIIPNPQLAAHECA